MKPIIVRGGGDLATGTIHRLCRCGYSVIVLEAEEPSAIRRQAAFCQAVYQGEMEVEGIVCKKAESLKEALEQVSPANPMLLIDPLGECLKNYRPEILIDAIIAKENTGTKMDMANLTIALGPGFEAGKDVDYVIETKRGHYLGRIIERGTAILNTGIPGIIGGYGKERVLHAPGAGTFCKGKEIGDWVEKGEAVGWIATEEEKLPVFSLLSGVVRGIIHDGYPVTEHFKIADVDPRKESENYCRMISDKARCIAGSVLELVCAYEKGLINPQEK